MTTSQSRAREARFRRLIAALHAAAAALETVALHEPIGDDTGLRRSGLRREIEEYAGYLEQATWWRA